MFSSLLIESFLFPANYIAYRGSDSSSVSPAHGISDSNTGKPNLPSNDRLAYRLTYLGTHSVADNHGGGHRDDR